MASLIDVTKPVDGVPAVKADIRANWQRAKDEIEALQAAGTGESLASGVPVPATVLVDEHRLYDTYTQSGAVAFAKAGAGTFRRGKILQMTFVSDGNAITWSSDFEPLELQRPLPSVLLPAGPHTLLFSWNSYRAKIQVSLASLLAEGAILKDYSEVRHAQSGVTGAVTLNYANGQKHTITHGAGNITSVTITNWPPSGEFGSLTVDWIQDGTGGRTLADPASTSWFGGTPTFNTAAGKRNRAVYTTEDGGATIQAHYAGAL